MHTQSNAYTKQEINNNVRMYDNALNNTSDKLNTYSKSELDNTFADLPASSVDVGGVFRLNTSANNNTFLVIDIH